MTKVKLKEATQILQKNAESVLQSLSSVRKNAGLLAQNAKKLEAKFQQAEDQRKAEEKQAEQQRIISLQAKAYTMPDSEEVAEPAPVAQKKAKPAAKAEPKPAKADDTPVSAEAQKAAPVLKEEPKAAPASPVAEKPAVEEPALRIAVPKASPEQKVEKPIAGPSEESAPVKPIARPTQDSAPAKPIARPAQESAPAKPIARPAQESAPAKPIARPAQESAPAKPIAQPAQEAKPAPIAQPAKPMAKPAQDGAPSAPSAPQEARPAAPVQQGPYGRPANGQQYGRPVNPNGAQQGQYGRPVNGGQPGQYGRPVNGGQPGQYGRPVNGGQPGQYGRPVNGGQPGQYGRPVNGGQQGGFGRPANGQGGAPRPQGAGHGPAAGPRKPAGGLEMTPAVEKERVSNYDPNKKNYIRQHDPEHVSKNRKQLARETMSSGGFDDDVVRGGRKSKGRKPSAQQLMAPIKIDKAYMTAETITVKDLTERIGKPAGEILKKLLLLGEMHTINDELNFDTASLVCSDFGIELELNLAKTAEDTLSETDIEDTDDQLQPRPPVVTIMGHVDHGKTSLLDHIRKSRVTAGEAGGITQHIGAYTVTLNDRPITFLDTPGHEAFTAMRMRGAQATDIAILVVAADDGVMPQTVEAIHHAKAADVPVIVAINKMDKPTANPDRVKQDLTAYELIPEEWGGDTIMVPVSAMTGAGVDDLLEMILLQADTMELRANPDRMAKGVIIEAKLDKARGPLATVLLQNGTLHVGDNIVAGTASGRVRALLNDRGERVKEAGPSMPVEISGFDEVPSAGDDLMAVEDDRLARQVVAERKDKLKAERNTSSGKVTLDNLFSRMDQNKQTTLNIIVKADVQGSVEAVKQALEKLSNDEVKVRILHSAVGAIKEDDVNLASAFNAIIIGFNIRPDASAKDCAEREGVDIRLYRVIYQAIEEIEKAMKGMLDPEFKEVLLGHAEVRNTFRITGAGTVAGSYVKDGKVQRNAQVRLLRDNVVIYEGKLSSLKRFKDDAKEVAEGYECGISFDGYNDIKEGDIIECFVMEQIER